jgi:hypothetical protein
MPKSKAAKLQGIALKRINMLVNWALLGTFYFVTI